MRFVHNPPNLSLLFLIFVLTPLFFIETALADDKADVEKGVALAEKGEYAKAFKQFKHLAEAGNAEAQHNLAMLYRTGKGVKKDFKESAFWFRKAADQGIADAQYFLGYMYDTGEGVMKNKQYAYVWYRKAAEKGHGMAQINLGVLYAEGVGVHQDLEQAYLWFHVAAAQGYEKAFEDMKIIEKDLKPEVVKTLKKKGNIYFQKYVQPFQRHPAAYPQLHK